MGVTDGDSGTARGKASAAPGNGPAAPSGPAAPGAQAGARDERPAGPGERLDDTGEQAEALSYEQARDELVSVVKRLEAGGLTLEQSLQLWERGERLAGVCGELLEGARARLSAVMAERPGEHDPDAPF
jgi:exodeoxyribonuclease VII small subunit